VNYELCSTHSSGFFIAAEACNFSRMVLVAYCEVGLLMELTKNVMLGRLVENCGFLLSKKKTNLHLLQV